VNFKFHEYTDNDDFSESEVAKLTIYDEVTNKIIQDIIDFIQDEDAKIFIEGYSYSSAQGRLIDLVTFSTLLRFKLIHRSNVQLHVIPPSTLKKSISDMVYVKDKKGVSRDDNGKAGGSFDKKDMMVALLKLEIDEPYTNYLKLRQEDLLKPKNISKPFDDINDSLLLTCYGIQKYDIKK